MDIKITVEAPGLVQAIENLAAALANQSINPLPTSAPVKEAKKETEKKETKGKVTPLDTFCSVCKEPQVETPSGITCKNGHGGADPLEAPEDVEETKEDAPEITLVTVRSYLQKLQDAGRQKDAKAILVDLGHKKLSDVPKDEFPVIIAKVEELLA